MLTGIFSAYTDQLVTQVQAIQTSLDGALGAASALKSLPIIGQQLGAIDHAQSLLDNASTSIQTKLNNLGNNGNQTQFEQAVDAAIGPSGLNILGAANDGPNSSSTTSDLNVTTFNVSGGTVQEIDMEMRLHWQFSTTVNLSFNLGIPSMPIQFTSMGSVTVSASVDVELAVDYNGSISFPTVSLDDFSPNLTPSPQQVAFSLTASLSNNASLSANVGLLEGTLTPNGTNALNAAVYLSALTSPSVSFGNDANNPGSPFAQLNLMASLGFGNGSGGQAFPSIGTTITMNWANPTDPSTLDFSFGNVELNLGQYFSTIVAPVLQDIQQYTEPIQNALNVLTTPIPGIDAVLPGFSLMTAITTAGTEAGYGPLAQIVSLAATITQDINNLNISPNGNVDMPFGDFNLDGSNLADSAAANMSDLADPVSSLNFDDVVDDAQGLISDFASNIASKIGQIPGLPAGVASALTSIAQTALAGAGGGANASIDFPLFDNPSTVLNLLFGQDPDLVAFNGSFNGSFSTDDIPPGASFGFTENFSANVQANASIKIGYDTYGLRELIGNLESGNDSPSTIGQDIVDGFYIQGSTGPGAAQATHLTINGSVNLSGGVGGSIGVGGFGVSASIGPSAGLTGNVSVTLDDGHPDSGNDGKIRLSEMEYELQNSIPVFNASGSLTAGLGIVAQASVNTPLGSIGVSDTLFSVPTQTLWNSSSINNASLAAATPPPNVESIFPASGVTAGGNQVTIYGENLENANSVSFNYDLGNTIEISDVVPAYDFVSDGPTSIVVDAPAQDPGTVGSTSFYANNPYVVVATQAGTTFASSAAQYTYIAPPVITNVTVHSGPSYGGTLVTIDGMNLLSSPWMRAAIQPTVYFGNNAAVISSEQNVFGADVLQVYSPRDPNAPNLTAAQVSEITITTPGGTTVPDTNVLGASPESPGPDDFWYIPPPVITSMTPTSAKSSGGGTITIDGEDFGDTTTDPPTPTATAVTFGYGTPERPLSDTYVPAEQVGHLFLPAYWIVTATIPSSTTSGWTDVTVTTSGGGASIPPFYGGVGTAPPDVFTYFVPPVITSISPTAGPVTPLFGVAIYGQDFTGATAVNFGQTVVTNFTFNEFDSSEIDLTPPAASGPSTVQVTVTTPGGTSNSVPYTYTTLPVVSAVSPPAGPLGGGTIVTITGANLESVTELQFGKFTVVGIVTPGTLFRSEFISDTATQIEVASPNSAGIGGAGTLDVQVLTVPGCYSQLSSADHFTYTAAPIVSAVSPNFGPYEGGTTVTISGNNLANAKAVDFGSNNPATNFGYYANGTLWATSPSGTLGYTDVTVTTAGGTSATSLNDKFDYELVAPVIDGMNPASGPVTGETPVTITGANLLGTTAVDFATNLGSTPAISFAVVSSTEIEAVSPPHPAGEVAVRVYTPGEESITSYPDQFTYTTVSSITSVTPSSGPATGGALVTITGTNLSGATAVDFGSVAGNIVPGTNTSTQIEVATPPGSGTVDVTVTTPTGPTGTSPSDQFTYQTPAPIVSSVSPDTGGTGTTVTISGSYFSGVTAVDFGSTPATSFQYISASGTITATSPSGSGTVDVTVETAAGTSTTGMADQFTYGNAPTISAMYNPVGGPGNNGPANYAYWQVDIIGGNLTGATEVDFGDYAVRGANLTPVQNNGVTTLLNAVVPDEGPGTVDVRVVTPNGRSAITPADEFTFVPGPFVIDLETSPGGSTLNSLDGPLTGGTSVTIRGIHLADAAAVYFGNTPVTDVTYTPYDITSPSEFGALTVASPPASVAGTVNLTVTSPEGTSPTTENALFSYMPIPTISGISPASGPLAGGNEVAIGGTGLSYGDAVDFGGVPDLGFITYDTNTIYVNAPAGLSLGTVDVTVTTAGGSATDPSAYTYLPPPVVSGLSVHSDRTPSGALEGGTPVTIAGANLTGATAVDFGSTPADLTTLTYNADGSITVNSPAGAQGQVDVTVTTGNGTSVISEPADVFTYTLAPYITLVTGPVTLNGAKAAGFVAGGDAVTIEGDDLSDVTAVNFGNTPADLSTLTYNADGSITVNSPEGAAGTVNVMVTTSMGASDISAADQFTYGEVPSVAAISPTSGRTEGDTPVMISGTGLAYATEVDFGPSNPASIISATDGQMLVSSPGEGNGPGRVDVTVVTPFGTSSTSSADLFTYVAAPSISSQDTYSGPVGGGTQVTITGTGLANVASVDFGSNPATIISDTSGQLVVVSPEATGDSTGQVDLSVISGNGTATSYFNYALPPSVTALDQTTGPTAGGTTVNISGAGFTGATAVDFGGAVAASFAVNDDGWISAVSPPGVPSTVDVTVTAPGGTSLTSSADQFTYEPTPIVTQVNPSAGPIAGGAAVTVYGSGLAGATEVDFNDGQGNDYAGTIQDESQNQIVVISPDFGFADVVDITVTTVGGTSATSAADQFTFAPPPSVTDLSATSGFRAGGDPVSIYGANLYGATAVDFGVNPAAIIDESANQIDVYSPPGSDGTVDVTVVTAGVTSAASAQDQFTYTQPVPVVAGVSPSVGAAAGGEKVTITGTDLDNASAVYFGGVEAPNVTSDSPTQIMATVPTGTLGIVDITVTTGYPLAGGGTSNVSQADQFTGIAAPVVAGLDTLAGPISGGTDVTVYGTDLGGATAVNFGQTAGTIIVDAGSYILAQSPPGSAGNVPVKVTTAYGTSAASSADQFTYVAPPTTAPESYSVTTGTTLSVDAAGGVLANDTDPQELPLSASLLTNPTNGTLSLGSDGSFTYTPNSGYVGPDSFTYQATNGYAASARTTVSISVGVTAAAPVVTGIVATSGPATGGTSVTITGEGFTGATAVDFGGVSAKFTFVSDTEVTATSPAGTALVDVTVTTPNGTSATGSADKFAYIGTTIGQEIIDNNEPGFWSSSYTNWNTSSNGLGGTSLVSSTPNGSEKSQAAWWFSMPAGLYEISVTYTPGANLTKDMGLDLYDGVGNFIGEIPVNEQIAPNSFTEDGVAWENLGAFKITSNIFHISTWNSSTDGAICINGIQLQAAPVVDDANAPNSYTYYPTGHVGNFTTSGLWTTATAGAFGGSHTSNSTSGSGLSTATWTMPVTLGTYEVDATWPASASLSATATYNVYDGATKLGSVAVNQRVAPSGIVYEGINWQSLGSFPVKGTQLIVTLSNTAADGQVSADAVRILPSYQPTPIVASGAYPGFWSNSNWTTQNTGLYGSSMLSNSPNGSEQSQAAWWFGVQPGQYEVFVTWVPGSNLSPTAPFDVYNALTYISEPTVNEQNAPVGVTDQGVVWQSLGTFTMTSDVLHVSTWNKETNGAMCVDGIRIVPVGS